MAPESSPPEKQKLYPYTCNTCQVAFRSHEAQKTHYHSDWHQYNLKRKISSLPPLSSEIFAEKVLTAQANNRLERERATFEKLCKPCNKVFLSENAFANHVGSQKHRQNVASFQMNALRAGGSTNSVQTVGTTGKNKDEKDDSMSIASSTFSLGEPVGESTPLTTPQNEELPVVHDKVATLSISSDGSTPTPSEALDLNEVPESSTPLPINSCLFCPYISPTLTLNVNHMTRAHGLFIPEASYLVDLAGLVSYLGQKLVFGNQCLYCNKPKGGLEGIRTHMQDKGHTMLGFETEEQQVELGQFYDFRSTYSDAGEESSSSDGADPSKSNNHTTRTFLHDQGCEAIADGEGDGEAWETDSDTSVDSMELGSVPIDRVHGDSRAERYRHHMQDGWHSHAHSHVYHDDFELHLPSGRSVGHRALARYYKQNLRDYSLQDKSIRRLADTRYPRYEIRHDDDDDNDDNDDNDGGVKIHGDIDQAFTRRERRDDFKTLARLSDAGMVGVSSSKRREVAKLEKRSQMEENRGRRKYEWGVNKQNNFQKHFRDPLLQ